MTLILEVALGLAFVYLLFSLFVSAVNEIVLGHLAHLRARLLEDSIRALLSGTGSKKAPATETLATIWSIFKSVLLLFQPKRTSTVTGIKFADRVLQHPLVQGLATDGKCPSYMPAKTFADAVLEGLTRVPNAMGTPFETTAALKATDDFAHQVAGGPAAGRVGHSPLYASIKLAAAKSRGTSFIARESS